MKSRYWTIIVYPDSAPEDWKEQLSSMGLIFAVSPLHDKDIDIDGNYKKAHWHILITYPGPTTFKNVQEIQQIVHGALPKKVQSVRGMYRYFTHMDNPEKAQYDIKDIECYGGFELDLTTTEVARIMKEITQDIRNMKIKEYSDLIDYYDEIGDNDKWELTSNHTFFLDKYICSKRNKEKQMKENTLQIQKKVLK